MSAVSRRSLLPDGCRMAIPNAAQQGYPAGLSHLSYPRGMQKEAAARPSLISCGAAGLPRWPFLLSYPRGMQKEAAARPSLMRRSRATPLACPPELPRRPHDLTPHAAYASCTGLSQAPTGGNSYSSQLCRTLPSSQLYRTLPVRVSACLSCDSQAICCAARMRCKARSATGGSGRLP